MPIKGDEPSCMVSLIKNLWNLAASTWKLEKGLEILKAHWHRTTSMQLFFSLALKRQDDASEFTAKEQAKEDPI